MSSLLGRIVQGTLFVVLLAPGAPNAQIDEARPGDVVVIDTEDDHTVKGTVVELSDEAITVVTAAGLRVVVPRRAIARLRVIPTQLEARGFTREDPNYSRLMFAPTGRPLRRGDGYFADYYVLLPGVAYGFTNNVSLFAGVSLVPGIGLDEQMLYVAPRVGMQINDNFAASVGTLFVSVSDFRGGLAFGVVTGGGRDGSVTMGVAIGYTKESGEDFRFADEVVFMFGGNARVSNSIAFVSESYIQTDRPGDEQPFAVAIRFFGDRLAADFGFVILGEVIRDGLPIPWLSMVYNFGK